ncbi:MAG: hypothetical protein HY746_01160 [Elusimicrobia bacterium]|nr:hypothetical protein [Elusimicrobiota bacterium]
MKILIVLALMFPFSPAWPAEADHYTLEDAQVADITGHLNLFANQGMEQVIDELNASGPACDDSIESEQRLYEGLTTVFANHSKSQLIRDILEGKIERTVIPLKESVYGEWTIWNGFLLGRKKAADSPLALSPLVRVGDIIIGADKIEHMFGMGFAYFKKHYLEGKKLVPVLKLGIFKEKTFLGGNIFATGVFSYADLAANFNGMRFWNHFLQKSDDILGSQHNLGPYVVCRKGQWEKNPERPLDFRNYIDPAMQESVNCSKFATHSGARKFKEHLATLQEQNPDRAFTCPVSVELLEQTARKYEVVMPDDRRGRRIDHWIINREGNEKVSYFNEF